MYYINYLLLQINDSPYFIYLVFLIAQFVGVLLLYDIGRRASGQLAGLVAALVFVSSPLLAGGIGRALWNPTLAIPFALLAHYFFYRILLGSHARLIVLASVFLAIAAQMHISQLMVLLIFLTLLRVYQPHTHLKIYAGAAVAILAVYSPWLAHVLFGLFPESQIPILPTQSDIAVQFRQWIKNIYDGASFGEPNVINAVIPFLALFIGGLASYLLHFKWPQGDERNRLIVIVDSCLWIICISIVIGYAFTLKNLPHVGLVRRYYFILMPSTALLSGVSLAVLIRWYISEYKSAIGAFTTIILLLLLGIRGASAVFVEYRILNTNGESFSIEFGNYATKIKLLDNIHNSFGFGRKELQYKTTLISQTYSKPAFAPSIQPMDYIIKRENYMARDDAYDGCVIVVSRMTGVPGEYMAELKADEAVKILLASPDDKFTIEKRIVLKQYVLIGVRFPYSTCPKSISNSFNLSAGASELETIFVGNNTTKIEKRFLSEGNTSKYAVRLPFKGTNYDMKFLIDISSKNQIVSASLHSKQLNNVLNSLQGYWEEFYFENTILWLKNNDTEKKFKLRFFKGTLGRAAYTTPWRGHSIALPKGKYSIRFTADRASRREDQRPVPVDVDFPELFTVN